MNYCYYASLLNASSNLDAFGKYLLAFAPEFSILKATGCYLFIQSKSQLIVLVPGNVVSKGNQIMMQPAKKQAFRLLQDFKEIKQKLHQKKLIGVGYSNGANLILALADIDKQLEVICFNPIGLGKKLQNIEFYDKFSLNPENPNLNIYTIETNELSKQFSFAGCNIHLIPNKTGLSPHSLLNFEAETELKIEGISKYFPKISMITFSPKAGFMLIETENSLDNYYLEGDLAAIFYSVYSNPDELSFTLVPSDKNNPSGPFQTKVYTPSSLEGTLLGNYLWEADWKLKQMDLGLWYDDLTGQTFPISAEISWFKSGFDFYCEENQERSIVRLWFVMDKVNLEYSSSDKGICIKPSKVGIKIQAKRLEVNSDTRFGLKDTEDYHTAYKFADYLNCHMDEICELIPEIQRLKELSVLIAIAKFFRDDLKIPAEMINLPLLKSRVQTIEDYYEKCKVPRISRKAEFIRGEDLVVLNLTGGVSMISQETNKVCQPSLIEYANRSDEILTPFYLSHYDYVKEMIEFQESTEDEDSGFVAAFEFCRPNECSIPTCNNFVIFDCKKVDSSKEIFEEITPYSYEGKLYCKEHHPYRCTRDSCRETIFPGESYAELEYGRFHSSCIVCEYCSKGIVSSYLYEKGFWHVECFKFKDEVDERKKAEKLMEEQIAEEELRREKEEKMKNLREKEEILRKAKEINREECKKNSEESRKVNEEQKKVGTKGKNYAKVTPGQQKNQTTTKKPVQVGKATSKPAVSTKKPSPTKK